jgi:clan AA aspartic protease
MIRGIVTREREALIRLTVFGSGGRRRSIEAVVDTGFDGYLTLPPNIIADLGLAWLKRGSAELADGEETEFDVYRANVLWDNRRRSVLIDESNSVPLLGMSLLEGYALKINVQREGQVTISRLRS